MEQLAFCRICQEIFVEKCSVDQIRQLLTSILDENDPSNNFNSTDRPLDPNTKSTIAKPCCFCTGIILECLKPQIKESLKLNFVRSKYDCNSINVGVSFPLSWIVREHLINLHLAKSDVEERISTTALKDVLRIVIQLQYEAIGLVLSASSPLSVIVIIRPHLPLTKIPTSSLQSGPSSSVPKDATSTDADSMIDTLVQLRPTFFRERHVRRGRQRPSLSRNQITVAQALADIPNSLILRSQNVSFTVPPPSASLYPGIEVKYTHSSVFVGGRYNKLARGLAQTPWIIDGQRRGETSVQELIIDNLSDIVLADEIKFSSSGREDCDVRMLGTGRPFLLEFINPRRASSLINNVLLEHEKHVNQQHREIFVRNMSIVNREHIPLLHLGAEKKKKTYACPIWLSGILSQDQIDDINSIKNLEIEQQTPMRVCHRRTLMTRQRSIYSMHIQPLPKPQFYLLELCTQSGTYIKEFVHGDFGRTRPNLCTIFGMQADVVALDVTDVDLQWPPLSDGVA
eukprot:gene4958-6923_t